MGFNVEVNLFFQNLGFASDAVRFFFIGASYGRGGGVGRTLGVEPGLGVGEGLAVAVAVALGVTVTVMVGVGVTVAIAVTVGVAVALGVDVAVGVGVTVGVAEGPCTSKEPLSMRPLTIRSNPGPRWSYNGGGVKFGSPALMAGLPGNKA